MIELPTGDYAPCSLLECECVLNRFGKPSVDLKFELPEGQHRTVNIETEAGGKFAKENFGRLDFLGFNYDVERPAFDKAESVSLNCVHITSKKGHPYEQWYVNTMDFASSPLPDDMKLRTQEHFNDHRNRAPAASTPKSAPPAKSSGPPPAKNAKVTTKDSAWSVWEKRHDNDVPADKWQEAIASIGDENDFTQHDWNKIAEMASLPF